MIVTKESGKKLTYEKSFMELMTLRVRFQENEERRERLGLEVDKVVKIEMI